MNELMSVLFSWLLAMLCWAPAGLWLLRLLRFDGKDSPVQHFIIATIVGAAANATLLGFISLFQPITFYTSGLLAMVGILLFSKGYRTALHAATHIVLRWDWHSKIGLVVLAVLTILGTLHVSLNNDSGLYYIQFMKWMNSYPVIPGLANLHDRLGFNSHWHLLNAAFNVNHFVPQDTNDLNALLFLLMGVASFDAANRLVKEPRIDFAVWALAPLVWFLLARFLTSTAPDLPATLLPILYFILLLGTQREGLLPVVSILMAFAITIKVISVIHVLALVPMIFDGWRRNDRKSIGISAALALLVLTPWFARNVIQTGYLIFPMESIDLFHFDWKVPNELAANLRKMVDTHARTGSYDLSLYGQPLNNWFPFWLSVQSKTVLAVFALGFAGIALMSFSVFIRVFNRTLPQPATVTFIGIAATASVVFWWTSGPNPRFIYGIVFFGALMLVAIVIAKLHCFKWLRLVPLAALLPFAIILRGMLAESGPKRPTAFSQMRHVHGLVYYPTDTDKCWDHDLPCADMDRPALQFRGTTLAQGFATK
jgi:hypothetical protein